MTQDEAMKFIDTKVKTTDLLMFMKGTPDFPMCGFSGRVVQIFTHLGYKIEGVNVLDYDTIRNGVKTYSNWPTIPQIYIKGEFVGGCDIVVEMAESGELQKLLASKFPNQAAAPQG